MAWHSGWHTKSYSKLRKSQYIGEQVAANSRIGPVHASCGPRDRLYSKWMMSR